MKKWLGTAVVALIANGASANQEQPGAAELKACREAAAQQNWDSVLSNCKATLEASPSTFYSHYLLGWAYMQKRDWSSCASSYEAFLEALGDQEAETEREVSTRQAGVCYAQARNDSKAIPFLEKAARAKPSDAQVQFFLGLGHMRMKRESEAERAFAQVLSQNPKGGMQRSYYYAGVINFRQEQWPLASQRLEKYLELQPNDAFAPEAHFMVGSMAIREGEAGGDAATAEEKARVHMEQFLAGAPESPNAPQAHYYLGGIAAQKEDNATAKIHFEKYLEMQPEGAQAAEAKRFLEELAAAESEPG